MIGVGIIGYGYWGPNILRNFADLAEAEILSVCDPRESALAQAKHRYPSVTTTVNPHELLADKRIEAVAIATPVSTHYDLALEALRAGKHVLITKPLASSSEQATRLIEEAAKRRLVLMVDHTFLYTGAVRKMRELVSARELGDIYYYDSVRVNLGLFQHDVNVIWDLAVHDLSIMDFVLGAQPHAVSATGMSHVPGGLENIAYLTLFFDNRLIGHIHVNWLSPVKVRRTLLGGSRKMIVYDDFEPSEKIKVYDKGITVDNNPESIYKMLIGYRAGDMLAPQIDITEALKTELSHFLDCVKTGRRPLTDGEAGLRTIVLLEAATRSMQRRGEPVEIAAAHASAG